MALQSSNKPVATDDASVDSSEPTGDDDAVVTAGEKDDESTRFAIRLFNIPEDREKLRLLGGKYQENVTINRRANQAKKNRKEELNTIRVELVKTGKHHYYFLMHFTLFLTSYTRFQFAFIFCANFIF